MRFRFRGLMPPVLTPFRDDPAQSINFDIIPDYAKFLKKLGIEGVLVNGTSGEGMSMTVAERKATTEAWAKAVKETKQALMVQVGGACLKDVKEMAQHCESLGVDGLLCLPDLFNKPSNVDDLVEYLQEVASAASKTPLLYYHLPGYTGVHVEISKLLVAASAKIPSFAGAKFTDTNLQEGARGLKVNSELSLFLGCDEIIAGAVVLGFDSAIATTLNMLPALSQKIWSSLEAGNTKEATLQQQKLTEAISLITRNGGWVATMKAAMNLMTPINVGNPRPPLKALTTQQVQQMKDELKSARFQIL